MLSKDAHQMLCNRINDLVTAADKRRRSTHTEFLDMTEASYVISYLDGLRRDYELIGGYEDAERKVALIAPDYSYEEDHQVSPLSFIHIQPSNHRYNKAPSHRDYLGALMNLGIERRVLGDILMVEDGAIVICMAHIEAYVLSSLVRVGQVDVTLDPLKELDPSTIHREFKVLRSTVASLRLDSIVKACTNLSRGDSANLIRSGKVFVNGREMTKISYSVKEGQVLSIRGLGKYKLRQVGNKTKKDRLIVEIDKYT